MTEPSRELGGGGQRGSHRLENYGTIGAINPPWVGKDTEARKGEAFLKKAQN